MLCCQHNLHFDFRINEKSIWINDFGIWWEKLFEPYLGKCYNFYTFQAK